MLLDGLELKFNYGLSRQFPVSLFVKLAKPESSYKEVCMVKTLYDRIKNIQRDTNCYHVVLYNGLDYLENVEDSIWVFSRLLESMQCSLSVIIQEEAEFSMFSNNLFSASYTYVLSDKLSITKNCWHDVRLLEEDLLICNVDKLKDLKALRDYTSNKNIKARVGFNSSLIPSQDLIESGIIDLVPIPLALIL